MKSTVQLLLSLSFLFLIHHTYANDCSTPEIISSVPYSYSGTTFGAGDNYDQNDACSNNYMRGNDFVFEYNSPGGEVLTVQLNNLTDDRHGLFILDGCPDDPATNCLYVRTVSGTAPAILETVHFQNPGQFFIVVSSYEGFTTFYDFELIITLPIGNLCENAEIISSVPFTYVGTTVGSGDDYNENSVCQNNFMRGNDFVFEYNSPGSEVLTVQLNNLTDDYHGVFILDGCPNDPLSNCIYASTKSNTSPAIIETVHFPNPGQFFIVVSSYEGFTTAYDFELIITEPVGNICENARQITGFPYTFTGSTLGAGDEYNQNDACNSTHMRARDYLFSYTPSGNEYLDLTLTNLNDDTHGLFIVDACPNDPLANCVAQGTTFGTTPIVLNTSSCLSAGTTYYIIVSSYQGFTDWFDFTLDIDQNLQATINATESSGLTNDNYLCDNEAGTAIVNFTASATGGNGGGYSFLWDNPSGSTTAEISETPLATTTYTVTATDVGGCSVVESYTIEVDPALNANIVATENSGSINDNVLCAYGAGVAVYTLDASVSNGGFGSLSYTWNTSANTAVINEIPNVATTYTVSLTDDHNCIETASQQVTINPVLSVNVTGTENSGAMDDLIICGPDAGSETAVLTATPSGGTSGYTYNWSPQNGVNPTLTTTPNVSTTYTVILTDSNGCDAIENITVEVVSASCIWTGPTNMNWYDNPNFWSLGRFPTVCDHVVIPSGKFVTLRNGFHGWGNTLEVDGELETRPGAELDIVTQY